MQNTRLMFYKLIHVLAPHSSGTLIVRNLFCWIHCMESLVRLPISRGDDDKDDFFWDAAGCSCPDDGGSKQL
jgi:hypothetical protein